MFGFLKKKLSKAVDSISDKFKDKEQIREEVEKEISEVEKERPEKLIEKIEQRIPEAKEVIGEIKQAPEKKGFFKKIKEKIVKEITEKKFSEKELNPILHELENSLIESDVAYQVARKITDDLKKNLQEREIKKGKEKEVVLDSLRKSILEIFSSKKINLEEIIKKAKNENRPAVILFLGFNGSGKTTSIAKMGRWLMDKGYSVMFAAADSWRAAAIEQLEEHGRRLKVNVVKHKYGGDPAAIVFDGVASAKAKGINVLLADSAGRIHVNKNLIEELKKIVRVNKPDLKILVMESLTGNDCPIQLKHFDEAVGVDAVILTKMDVNEKGGAALSIAFMGKPILFVGTGQNYDDIKEFDKDWFVNQLLS